MISSFLIRRLFNLTFSFHIIDLDRKVSLAGLMSKCFLENIAYKSFFILQLQIIKTSFLKIYLPKTTKTCKQVVLVMLPEKNVYAAENKVILQDNWYIIGSSVPIFFGVCIAVVWFDNQGTGAWILNYNHLRMQIFSH